MRAKKRAAEKAALQSVDKVALEMLPVLIDYLIEMNGKDFT